MKPSEILICVTGVALGALVGAAIGFELIWWATPSAENWVRLLLNGLLFVTLGVTCGALFGVWAITKRPWLFVCTIVPLALFFGGKMAWYQTLRSIDRPRLFVIKVSGTEGAAFVGVVSVNGRTHKLNGVLPSEYEFEVRQLHAAFVLVQRNEKTEIGFDVLVNGKSIGTPHRSDTGVYQSFESFGYSEEVGGTSTGWHRMEEDEVNVLIERSQLPIPIWCRKN